MPLSAPGPHELSQPPQRKDSIQAPQPLRLVLSACHRVGLADKQRYLAALLYGCVPVMSDRLEALPLHEHPEVHWHAAALAAVASRPLL